MKKIEGIKDDRFKLCETIEDINIKRFIAIKEQVILREAGMDFPSLKDLLIKWVRAFDNESKSQMLIHLHDHLRAISNLEKGKDPNQLIFALMVVEKGEDTSNVDETMLMERLETLSKLGLKQGTVISETENFINALFNL